MIQQLDIRNLRSFEGDNAVAFAPITLLYGPNSAGKSSILMTLGLLKQTLAPSTPSGDEWPPLLLEGPIVDFGTFDNVLHRHDLTRELGLGVRFIDRDTPDRPVYAGLAFATVEQARKRPRGLLPEDAAPEDPGRGVLAFQTAAELGGGVREGGRVRFNRDPFDNLFYLDAAGSRQLEDLIEQFAADLQARGQSPDAQALRYMREQLVARPEGSDLLFLGRGFFPALPSPGTLQNQQTDFRYGNWFETTMYERALALGDLLDRLAYLGPLRATPARFQALSRSGERSTQVGSTGEHVTRLLAAPDREVLDKVNRWLQEDLEIGYRLEVNRIDSAEGLQIGDLYATTLIDRNGTRVTPQDVGFGISQVLPVVVQLLANRNSTICIEQPEIHIHPRLQARLGDLVLESAGPDLGNQVVIESHSEQLMRRIQRRLRLRAESPEHSWLTPETIAVNYVQPGAEGAIVKPLPLDEEGDFMEEWPGGFFEETFEEMFGR